MHSSWLDLGERTPCNGLNGPTGFLLAMELFVREPPIGEADPATAEVRDEQTVVLHRLGGDVGRPYVIVMRLEDGIWKPAPQ